MRLPRIRLILKQLPLLIFSHSRPFDHCRVVHRKAANFAPNSLQSQHMHCHSHFTLRDQMADSKQTLGSQLAQLYESQIAETLQSENFKQWCVSFEKEILECAVARQSTDCEIYCFYAASGSGCLPVQFRAKGSNNPSAFGTATIIWAKSRGIATVITGEHSAHFSWNSIKSETANVDVKK